MFIHKRYFRYLLQLLILILLITDVDILVQNKLIFKIPDIWSTWYKRQHLVVPSRPLYRGSTVCSLYYTAEPPFSHPMDWRTNRRMDRISYRDARTHLKMPLLNRLDMTWPQLTLHKGKLCDTTWCRWGSNRGCDRRGEAVSQHDSKTFSRRTYEMFGITPECRMQNSRIRMEKSTRKHRLREKYHHLTVGMSTEGGPEGQFIQSYQLLNIVYKKCF